MDHEFFVYLTKHDTVAAALVTSSAAALAAAAAFFKVVDDRKARTEKRQQDERLEAKAQAQRDLAAQAAKDAANAQTLNDAILEAAINPVIIADENLHIIKWTDAACVMFGWTRQEAVGKSVTLIIPENLRALHFAGVARYQETGKAQVVGRTVQLRGLHKDGRVFPVILSLSEGINTDGKRFYCGVLCQVPPASP